MAAKKIITLALLASGMLLLNGCDMKEMKGMVDDLLQQNQWVPQEADAISIDEDGTIRQIIQEKLDAAYYNAAELQNMITSEVAEYNKEHGENAVVVENYTVEGNAVTLEMVYAAADHYAEFNNVEFYYGSMINAQLDGYLFDASYKKVKDGIVKGSAVSGSEVLKEMDEKVLIVRAPLEVHVPGNVLFTSINAEVLAADVVNATGEQEEKKEEGLVLPSSAVFKWEEATLEEQAAANRVYIVFAME